MLASVSKNRQLSIYFRWSFLEEQKDSFKNININNAVSEFLEHNKDCVSTDSLRSKDFYYIPILTEEIHAKLIYSVSVSQDCEYVATGSRDKKIKVYSVLTKDGFDFKIKWEKKMKNSIRTVEFLEGQNRFLVVGLDNGEVMIVDIQG
jgi:WD40 repeat protein